MNKELLTTVTTRQHKAMVEFLRTLGAMQAMALLIDELDYETNFKTEMKLLHKTTINQLKNYVRSCERHFEAMNVFMPSNGKDSVSKEVYEIFKYIKSIEVVLPMEIKD